MTTPEGDGGDHRAADLGQVEQPDVERAVALGQRAGGERGRRHRCRRREQRHDDAGDRDRARRASSRIVSSGLLGPVLVDDQDDDRRQAAEQRQDRQGIEEAVARQLARRRRRRPRSRPPRARSPAGRAASRGSAGGASSNVSNGQHERHRGDPGDDPEQRPPGVRLGLQAADERAERDRAEDAHVHDHGGVAQLARRVADRQRRHGGDQQQARAEALDDVAGDVHRRRAARTPRAPNRSRATPRSRPASGAAAGAGRTGPPARCRPRRRRCRDPSRGSSSAGSCAAAGR